jgi:hypothetical protein
MMGTAWADMTSDLRDESNEYLAHAIEHYRMVLKVYTQENDPEMWAASVSGLGRAYQNYNPGDPTKSLQWAMQCYQGTLPFYTEAAFPAQRAEAFTAIAACYRSLPSGDRAANLQNAIHALRGALRYYTEGSHPDEFANCALDMARLYVALGEQTGNTSSIIDGCSWYTMASRCYEAMEDTLRVDSIGREVHLLSGEYPHLGIR